MAWYEDLSACGPFPCENPDQLRAVGWLERGRPFTKGDVDERVFERLCQLTQNPWSPSACAGVHFCNLCRFTGNSQARYRDFQVSAASSSVSLFVPGERVIYVCPTSITHYIDAHEYCPPAVFCEAVLRCPPMGSMEYLKAVLANGGRGLVKSAQGRD